MMEDDLFNGEALASPIGNGRLVKLRDASNVGLLNILLKGLKRFNKKTLGRPVFFGNDCLKSVRVTYAARILQSLDAVCDFVVVTFNRKFPLYKGSTNVYLKKNNQALPRLKKYSLDEELCLQTKRTWSKSIDATLTTRTQRVSARKRTITSQELTTWYTWPAKRSASSFPFFSIEVK